MPLIVITSDAHEAVTPAGRPIALTISTPVAPVVVCIIFVSGVLMQTVGAEDAAPAVLFDDTIIVPEAVVLPQPPVNGIV